MSTHDPRQPHYGCEAMRYAKEPPGLCGSEEQNQYILLYFRRIDLPNWAEAPWDCGVFRFCAAHAAIARAGMTITAGSQGYTNRRKLYLCTTMLPVGATLRANI
jgi:hypothetical protein